MNQQNIDGLEIVAGVSPELVVAAHGTFHSCHCLGCREEYSEKWAKGSSPNILLILRYLRQTFYIGLYCNCLQLSTAFLSFEKGLKHQLKMPQCHMVYGICSVSQLQ